MTPENHQITLELLLDGDGLSGRAVGGSGAVREFSGRLGLMHAIDELLADPAGSQPTNGAAAPGDGAERNTDAR